MKLAISNLGNISIVSVEGSVDGKTAPEAQGQILPLIQPKSRLILDMRGVNFMSSAGLRMLLLLYRQSTAQSSHLALVGLSQEVKDVMSMTGFLKFFAIFDTVDAAKEALA